MNKKLFLLSLGFLFTIFSCTKISKFEIEQFHNAVENGDIKFITKILESEEYKDNKRKIAKLINSTIGFIDFTPIHRAALDGRVNVAVILLENGADINDNHHESGTPLHLAVGDGHLEFVKFLIKNGADVNATTPRGVSVLDRAYDNVFHKNQAIINLLEQVGAKCKKWCDQKPQ